MNRLIILVSIFTIGITFAQQVEEHRWKAINLEGEEKYWFDSNGFDSVKDNILNVWVLQTHKPPLQFDSIDSDVFRSKTLYSINLVTAKYGLLKIRYYSVTNKEIYSYDYDEYSIQDDLKFAYPIMEGSINHKIVREYFNSLGQTK